MRHKVHITFLNALNKVVTREETGFPRGSITIFTHKRNRSKSSDAVISRLTQASTFLLKIEKLELQLKHAISSKASSGKLKVLVEGCSAGTLLEDADEEEVWLFAFATLKCVRKIALTCSE